MILKLLGEPKSTQHVYKIACRGHFPTMYMSAEGKKIKQDYKKQIKKQWKWEPIEGDVEITVRFYFGTKRRCDIDNFNKLLYDALTGVLWVDDSQIIRVITEKFYDKLVPRIEIEI